MWTVATAVVAGVVAAVGSGNSGFPLSIVRDGAPYDTVMSIPIVLEPHPSASGPTTRTNQQIFRRPSRMRQPDGEAPNSKLRDRALFSSWAVWYPTGSRWK